MSSKNSQRFPANLSSTSRHDQLVVPSNEIYPEEILEHRSGLNLRDFINTLSRHKTLLVGFTLATLLLSIIITLSMEPVYRASSTLQIERNAKKVVNIDMFNSQESRSDKDFYETQRQLIQSRALARRVINQLNLEKNVASAGIFSQLKSLIGLQNNTDKMNPSIIETIFLESLSVTPVSNSQLVQINYESTDPKLSAEITNAVTKTFVRMNLERRFDTASYSKEFLTTSINKTKKDLETSENVLNQYATKYSIIQMADGEDNHTHSLKKMTEELITAGKERIEAESAYEQSKQTADDKNATSVRILKDPYIQSLKKTLARLEANSQEILRTYSPRSSRAKRIRKQIDEVRSQINIESYAIKSALKSEFFAAKQKESMIKKQLEQLKKDALETQQKSIRYNTLLREVQSNRDLYKDLLGQLKQVNIAGNVDSNNISIIDKAGIPYKKFKPNFKTNIAFGLLLGLLLGMAAAFLREFMDDSVKNPDELERLTGLPVLGMLPAQASKSPRTVALQTFNEPKSPLAEAIRSLRTSLRFSTQEGAPKSMFITSSAAGEGKSTVALNLATAYAQAGNRILLIDADLRNPTLHKLFRLENYRGLTNYLAGGGSSSDIYHPTMIKNLDVITSGPIPPDPVELLSGKRMGTLLSNSSADFDYIIIDGPPVLGLADALVISGLCDATILTVEAGKTRKVTLMKSLKRLERAHSNLVGLLFTRVDRSVDSDYHEDYHYPYTGDKDETESAKNPVVVPLKLHKSA
ncbi:MAG TPA: polysaccharide biosynthesis tyrosine autokinase [Leucothrix mucor]|nr:polysaccharide biosynthesis tyrosine autokinase [Leucothrix mucor]